MSEELQQPTTKRNFGFLTLPFARDVAIIAAIIVLVGKLLTSQISINFSEFSFNDLLALILALFSIWLSTAFYFKANEASNQFYHNTFEFTQQTSVILGRIESGFGEKFNTLHTSLAALEQARKNVEIAQSDIAGTDEAGRQLIKELMNKAQLDAADKEKLLGQLDELKAERDAAMNEVRKNLASVDSGSSDLVHPLTALRRLAVRISPLALDNPSRLIEDAQKVWRSISPATRKTLIVGGYANSEGLLTASGAEALLKNMRIVYESKNGRDKAG